MLDKKVLPRICAAALALVASFATVPSASAAWTPQHYQQKVKLVCGSGCAGHFLQLTGNQMLDIHHFACDIITNGDLSHAQLAVDNFSYPLVVQWQRPVSGKTGYTFDAVIDFRVPPGKRAGAIFIVGGDSEGYCTLMGTLYTKS
jgi:hypothetical protein